MDPTQTRPGGLTALAVINVVLGGFNLIGIAKLAGALLKPEIRAGLEEELGHAVSDGGIRLFLVASTLEATLLIASGVGYLGQRRVLGRLLGSLYGLLAVATNTYEASFSGFHIGTMIGIVYPLLTLVLVNTTFKPDLVR